eukprot:1610380-Amphidinium_carterae.1
MCSVRLPDLFPLAPSQPSILTSLEPYGCHLPASLFAFLNIFRAGWLVSVTPLLSRHSTWVCHDRAIERARRHKEGGSESENSPAVP